MKTTEADSYYDNLEQMRVSDLLQNINKEDKTVPLAVEKVLPAIEKLVTKVVAQMKKIVPEFKSMNSEYQILDTK